MGSTCAECPWGQLVVRVLTTGLLRRLKLLKYQLKASNKQVKLMGNEVQT